MTSPVSISRFTPPAYRLALLPRDSLQARLDGALVHALTVLTAPAGYGKTSLLTQWRNAKLADGVRVGWLSIADDDMGPTEILSDLVLAIEQTGANLGHLASLAEQGLPETPGPAAVAALAVALTSETRELVVVIDDAHRISRESFDGSLQLLIAVCPAHVHLVVSGRERPPLSFPELRSRGLLLQLEAGEFRFSSAEARALMPDVTEAQLERLVSLTEGWPIALQLARVWLSASPDRAHLIARFSGSIADMAEYLTGQVLADLPPATLAVLRDVSMLASFNADLVAAVTGDIDAWQALLDSRKLDYLLVPLDEERYWFRYHHLLADYLTDRLRRTSSQHRADLNARASQWFQSHGLLREAVSHASGAGDYARAAKLIEQTGIWEMIIFGGVAAMRQLLRAIPPEQVHEYPRVHLGQLLLLAKDGDVARAFQLYSAVREATADFTRLTRVDQAALQRDLRLVDALIVGYSDQPRPADALERVYAGVEELSAEDGVGRATLLNAACLTGLALGDMKAALRACERAVHAMRHIGTVLGLNYCYVHLGLAHLHLGARREAEASFREAQALAEENFGADSGLKVTADVHLAVALHARGDLAGAQLLLDRSLSQVEASDGWLDMYAEAYETAAAVEFARGGDAALQKVFERARHTASVRALHRLKGLVEATAARYEVIRGNLTEAAAALSRVDPPFLVGRWRQEPFCWRVHHASGLAVAMLALARQDSSTADQVLEDLACAAQEMSRKWQLGPVRLLQAAALLSRGEALEANRLVVAIIEEHLAEDDLRALANLGRMVSPVLHSARSWASENWHSIRGRTALADLALEAARFGARNVADSPLSPREIEVLVELARGAPNKVIARALQMTENTVKFHLKNIFQKLRVRNRNEAVRAAREYAPPR